MFNRFKAFLLSAALLASSCCLPLYGSAGSGRGVYSASASYSEYLSFGENMLKQEQSLYNNGDGSYTFEMILSSRLDAVDQNKDSQKSQNGYFTATQSGSYLVELWGGDGAGGQSTSYSAGGSGGQGGHVYGVLNLAAGETLYYALGGNGTQTVSTDSGGGANGDGGSHGEIGSYTTGGGGGYSAVFKFEAGAFEQKYLSGGKDLAAVASIDETDRVSKYIMIAGGGGGGGAGNGFSIGGGAVGTPDGGAGGYIGGGSGVISGAGYDVSGVFFAGENGDSSGTSAEYTGRGGTNVPGSPSDTVTTLFNVESPNDWKGTYNSDKAGGSGGSGNMRGGSGGAGFCGGSGGIMTGLLLPTNVGGGGGGSSFIADGIVYEDLEEAQKLLLNENPSDTGGAVSIRYIGAEGAPEHSAAIEGRVSKYFDIEDASGIGCAVSYDGSAFAVSGALIPSDAAQSGQRRLAEKNADMSMCP